MAGEFDIEAFTLRAQAEGIDLLAAMRAEIERLSEQLRNSAAANDLSRESYDRIVPTIQALTTAYKNITRETVAAAEARKTEAQEARDAAQAAADEAERYRQYWQQKKQQIGEEKTEQKDRQRVVKETTIEILEDAKKEVDAIRETRRLEAEVAKEAAAANELLVKSEQMVAAASATEAEARHRVMTEEQQLAAFEETEASRRQARFASATKDIDNEIRQRQALDNAIELMAEHEGTAAKATVAATSATELHGKEAQAASQKQMAFARTLYFSAQAFEDLNYGFNAVLNNIPLITVSMAQMAGKSYESALKLAGGISIIGTGIMMLEPVIKKMYDDFTGSEYARTHSALETLQRELKLLKETPWFIHIDKRDIEEIEERVRRAKEALDAFQRANSGKTEIQQEAGRRVYRAVVESAGGTDEKSGADNITRAMSAFREANPGLFQGDAQFQDLQGRRKVAEERKKRIDSGLLSAEASEAEQSKLAQEIGKIQDIESSMRARDKTTVGGAIGGNEGQIDLLQKIIGANPEFFAAKGIGEDFRKQLASARRGVVAEDPDIKERMLKATPEGRKQNEANELAYKNEKQAEKDQIEEIAADRRAKAAKAKKDETERQQLNREGNRVEDKAARDAKRAEEKAEREHQTAINFRAGQVERSMAGNREGLGLDQAAERMLSGNQSVDQIVAALSAQLAAKIKNVVPANLLDAVAEKVVRSHAERVAMQGGMGMGGMAADRLGAFDQREANQGNRQAKQQFTRGLAGEIQQNYGTNDQVSMKAAQEAVRLGGANLNALNFVQAAVMDQMRQIQNLAHRVNQQDQQFRRNVRRGNNNNRGNNFPNRTD